MAQQHAQKTAQQQQAQQQAANLQAAELQQEVSDLQDATRLQVGYLRL
jgi:hypothetical protein